jgi:S-adenosyl-L-methionine hydrolase (adenosine-forming)
MRGAGGAAAGGGGARGAPPRITLLTDFGTADGYVAAMKGVIATIAPFVVVDDATHDIPPGDVAAGAWALAAYWRRYPPGTVHVAVVDPGVGGARRALAVRCRGRWLVAPDNGLVTRVLAEASGAGDDDDGALVVALDPARIGGGAVSATFHGRDVFAPAAAWLAAGRPAEELGTRAAEPPVRLTLPAAVREGEGEVGRGVAGVVVHVDRFGNLITNVPGAWLVGGGGAGGAGSVRVRLAGRDVPLVRTYGDAGPGELLALVGSAGWIEVAVRDGSAAALLEVGRGAVVRVRVPD